MLRLALVATLVQVQHTAAQSCQDFSKITQACPVHAVGRIVPSECDSDKDVFDNNCKAVFEHWYEQCHKTKHVTGLHKVHISQLKEFYMICQTTPTFFVRDAPLRLSKGNKLAVIKELDDDYSISFSITPGPTIQKSWASIIHFTATGNNYGHVGDRIPGIWFYPNSRRLHIIDGGSIHNVNDECPIMTQLKVGRQYQVRVEIAPKHARIYLDGIMACQEKRRDRTQFKGVTVYASDPWHTAADATISNFALDPQRDYTFVGKAPLKLHKGVVLATIDVLPVFYTFQFDLTPGPTKIKKWGSIIHLTGTNKNCCGYGDRIPGIWFYPGSRRLLIIDGHGGPTVDNPGQKGAGGSNGNNDECPVNMQLQAGRTVSVRIDMAQNFIRVFFNGQKVCDEARKNRLPFTDVKVYASDPWYPPADATISNFKMEVGETPGLRRHPSVNSKNPFSDNGH